MQEPRRIFNKSTLWVVVAIMSILGLFIALAPAAFTAESGPDRFRYALKQVTTSNGVDTDVTSNNPIPLATGDGGPLNGGGSLNLRYRVEFTCDVPMPGKSTCEGAKITMKIPDAAYRWDSDKNDGDGRLLQPPTFEVGTAAFRYFDTQVDELNRTVTLTVRPGWNVSSATGYINFPTSVHASVPGTEDLPVSVTYGDSTRESTSHAYTYGAPKPTVNKGIISNDNTWIRPGEIFEYSIRANRDKTEGTQSIDGVLVDTLPAGLKFLGFREVAGVTYYRLSSTGETFRVNYSYDEATRQIRVEIPEDFAAHYVRTNGLGVNVVVQVEDEATLKANGFSHEGRITNTVNFEWDAIDDKSEGTISSSVARKLDMPDAGGSGGIRHYKNQHGVNSAVTENEAVKSFELYFSNPTNGADLKVTDIPTPWPGDEKVITSPGSMELRTFPKEYYQDENGSWQTRDPQGSTMTFFYDDGTEEEVQQQSHNGWLVYANPRRDEFPEVRVTRTELNFPNAPVGNYQFVVRTDAVINGDTPDTYRAQNCMQYQINGRTIPASQNAKSGDANTSCVDISVAPLKADPWVAIGDGPRNETFTYNNGDNLLARLDGDTSDGLTPVSVSFGIFNSNPLAGMAKPTAYLTTPAGLKLNPDSLKWRDSNPRVNGQCTVAPDDLIVEELDKESPNGGRTYRVTLDPEKFPEGLPVNTDSAASGLTNCGIAIQVLRDKDSDTALGGGQYNEADLTQRYSGIAITVVEEDQADYIQSKRPNQTDQYGVVPTEDYPEGVTGAPKIHQEIYNFTVPAVNARVVSKQVKGDRDNEWKDQINWNGWTKEFATSEGEEPGYWDSAANREESLASGEDTVEYRISAGTEGTIPLESANLYDFLPTNENRDRGDLTGSSYESSLVLENGEYPENGMIPTLAGPVVPETIAADQVEIRYSRSTNPCRPDFPGVDATGCDPTWLSESEVGGDWASIKVIRIAFPDGVDRVHDFTYTMNMPPKSIRDEDGLRRSDIAYNQVAFTSVQMGEDEAMEPLGPYAAAVRYVPAVRVDKQIEKDNERLDTINDNEIPTYVEGDEVNYILNANNRSDEYVAEGVRVIDRLPNYLAFERAELIDANGNVIRELSDNEFIATGNEGEGTTEYAWIVGDMQPKTDQHLRVVSKVARIDLDQDAVIVPNYANIMTEDAWRDYDGVIDTKCEPNVGFIDDCDVVNAEIDLRKGAISGTYFRDVQAAGAADSNILDDADQRMAGQTVTLHYDWSEGKPYPFLNENGEPLRNDDGSIKTSIQTTTDAEGNYAFTGLMNGTYWVEFETRDGLPFVKPLQGNDPLVDSDAAQPVTNDSLLRQRTANIALGVGDRLPGYNAGVRGDKATIEGTIWFDKNEDGLQQAQEDEVVATETLMGDSATVQLLKDGEVIAEQQVTDGTYSFPGLDPGNYQVRVTDLPEGWRITDNPVGKDGNLVEADIDDDTVGKSGTIELDWGVTAERDVPVVNTASLAGTVYREDDRDGRVADGAPTMAGAIVYLLDSEGNRVLRGGSEVLAVTGADGQYIFRNLAPGSYGVEIVPPSGYVLSAQAGTLEDLDAAHLSDVSAETGKLTGIELSGSENQVNVDAVVNNRLSISGVVVNDADGDGLLDEGEGNFANIRVILTDEKGEPIEGIDPVQTDETGAYSFTDVPAREGGYKVKFVKPEGTAFSPQQTGGDITAEGRNDANAEGLTDLITAVAGQDKPNVDGYINNLGSISGHFYLEDDTNGIVLAGDPRISGVQVSTMIGDEEIFATVKEDGTYVFEGLPAGNYDLKFIVPEGYRISATAGSDQELTDGLRNDVSADGFVRGVPVKTGETTENVDLVVHSIGGVSGTVFIEGDKDGDITTNSNGNTLAGVTVELRNAQGDKVAETTTGADGSYRFENVVAGSGYVVVITDMPEGYNLSALRGSAEDISAENLNDFAPSGKATAAFTVESGSVVENVDAVVHQFGGISGRVVIEENTDGRIAEGETVSGASVIVRLLDGEGNPVTDVNGVEITTQPDENGNYSFAGLPAGEYQVVFDKPETLRMSPTTGGEDVSEPRLNDFEIAEGSNTARTTVTVVVGESTDNVDAILHGLGGISGRMVAIPNDSGEITDGVEPTPLGGQTVTLKLEDGGELTTTTNEDGTYVFEDVPAGDHTVIFPEVEGYTFSTKKGTEENLQDPNLNDADPETREVSVTAPRDGQVVNVDAILHGDSYISGIYFNDRDNDGVRDEAESIITDVRVELLDSNGTVIATTTTNEDGFYEFDNLVGGKEYRVRFITPQGMAVSPVPAEAGDNTNDAAVEEGRTNSSITEAVTPTADAPVTNLNGAATGTAELNGTIYRDAEDDGIFQVEDERVEGITVRLLDKAGNPVKDDEGNDITTTTDAEGNYSFRVEPGEYRVGLDVPENEAITVLHPERDGVRAPGYNDFIAEKAWTPVVTVSAGEVVNSIDGGIALIAGSISGTVIGERDSDGDATSGETMPVAGATVKLLQNGEVLAEVVTGEDGNYEFTDVEPGQYTVDVDLPQGWAHSDKASDVALDPRVNGEENKSVVSTEDGTVFVSVGSNEQKTNVDAVAHTDLSISGVFFDDEDRNGEFGENEGVVPGVIVELLDADGNVVADTVTDESGAYEFSGLFPGVYSVRFNIDDDDREAAREISPVNTGDEGIREDWNNAKQVGENPQVGETDQFELQLGESKSGVDAASSAVVAEPGAISGTIWNDVNRDGNIGGASEGALEGVRVELVDAEGNVVAEVETGRNGSYTFTDVEPGEYTVRVTAPEGYEQTSDPVNGTEQPVLEIEVTVEEAETVNEQNFGFVEIPEDPVVPEDPVAENGSISGVTWKDEDADGVIDDGEAALSGVELELRDSEGKVVATTTTAADGAYTFKDVEPGVYTVVVVDGPEGYSLVSDGDMTDGVSNEVVVTVEAGEDLDGFDFGYNEVEPIESEPAGLSGQIFHDTNRDGYKALEPGIEGVKVIIKNVETGETIETTTDEFGRYGVENLEPGTYEVTVEFPRGYDEQSADPEGPVTSESLTFQVELGEGDVRQNIDFGFMTDPEPLPDDPTTEPTTPTEEPGEEPSEEPTTPTDEPSEEPTTPTDEPSEEPTKGSETPTETPTDEPSQAPTNEPSTEPSGTDTGEPTDTTDPAGDNEIPAPVDPGKGGDTSGPSDTTGGNAMPAPGDGKEDGKVSTESEKSASRGGLLAQTGVSGVILLLGAGTMLILMGAALYMGIRRRGEES